MALTTSGAHPGRPQPGQGVAEMFRSLQELVGDWNVSQVVFVPAGTEAHAPLTTPRVNIGRMTCRSLIGGVGILVIIEIPAAGIKQAQMITFNPSAERFELALIDWTSDAGIILFTGQLVNTRSSEEIRAQFGKIATAVREWTLVQPTTGLAETTPVRIVENEITENQWVNQIFVRGAQGEVLAEQQVLTRVQAGCAPQLGCELGCAGLIGCQGEACAGLQGPNGVPQGQAPLLGQFPLTNPLLGQLGFPQLLGQAPLFGQAPVFAQVQLQLLSLLQLMAQVPGFPVTLPGLVPGACACTAAPACPVAPVPPPRQPVQPGRPGHPGK